MLNFSVVKEKMFPELLESLSRGDAILIYSAYIHLSVHLRAHQCFYNQVYLSANEGKVQQCFHLYHMNFTKVKTFHKVGFTLNDKDDTNKTLICNDII